MDNLNVEINSKKWQRKFKSLLTLPKGIFIILGVVVLIEIVLAVRTLSLPVPPSPVVKTDLPQAAQKAGRISLTVLKNNFRVSEAVPVSVVADTGSHSVDGIDLIVRFDPKILEATAAGLVKGSMFDEYPLKAVDGKSGLISISGINSLKSGFSGKGVFATINFRAKLPGKTALTVEFNKGSTADSNLVETQTNKDILESVDNLELAVQ